MKNSYKIIMLFLIIMAINSCSKIDSALDLVDESINMLENQSISWQSTLEETRDKLIESGHTTIANEVSNVLSKSISDIGVESRCFTDFLRYRVKEDLSRIRSKIIGKPISLTPVFCKPTPSKIDMSLSSNRRNYIEIDGYNFDSVKEQIKINLIDSKNRKHDITRHVSIPSQYLLVLNLGSNGVKLKTSSQKIVFSLPNNVKREIPIIQMTKPTIPLPPNITTSEVSEETSPALCPNGYVVKGMKCKGAYCDNKILICEAYLPTRDSYAKFNWSRWVSEESPNSIKNNASFVTGLKCKGAFCDNISVKYVKTPKLINKKQCTFISEISEERGRNSIQCPKGSYVAGFKCSGGYCDNISLYCCSSQIK